MYSMVMFPIFLCTVTRFFLQYIFSVDEQVGDWHLYILFHYYVLGLREIAVFTMERCTKRLVAMSY